MHNNTTELVALRAQVGISHTLLAIGPAFAQDGKTYLDAIEKAAYGHDDWICTGRLFDP
jgi:hypothetical protein